MGRPTIRLTCSASWSTMPGRARWISRTWKSRSKLGSATQYGWSNPNGTPTKRRRSGSSWPTSEAYLAYTAAYGL